MLQATLPCGSIWYRKTPISVFNTTILEPGISSSDTWYLVSPSTSQKWSRKGTDPVCTARTTCEKLHCRYWYNTFCTNCQGGRKRLLIRPRISEFGRHSFTANDTHVTILLCCLHNLLSIRSNPPRTCSKIE